MDRQGIIGIIVVVAGIIAWQWYYIGEVQRAARAQQEAAASAAQTAEKAPATPTATASPQTPPGAQAPAPSAAPIPVTPAAPAPPPASEEIAKLSTAVTEYSFTNLGGGIKRALLREHIAFNNHPVVLNEFGTIPIGAISETPGEGTHAAYSAQAEQASRQIRFERTDARQIQILKKFTLPNAEGLQGKEKLREEYLLRLDLSFTNRGAQPVQAPIYWVHTGAAAPIHQNDQPIYTGFHSFRRDSNKFVDVNWFKGGGFLGFNSAARPVYPEHPEVSNDHRWVGVANQYFTTLITPLVDPKAMSDEQLKQRGVAVWARRFEVSDSAWREAGHSPGDDRQERGGVDGAIGMAGFTLQPGETLSRGFNLYAGPREYRRLRELGNSEDEIMDFGMFGIVSKTLLNSMNTLERWFGNYAWAILVLTLIIKSLMWPLQNKATNSMKRMQALQPKMTELREKFKDDPQRMNTELMKLYKDYGVNPFSGCLPMLIQIPIFFGFYNMLGKAVELRNSKFLWVQDLSQPDTIFYLGFIPVNPLPLLMAATMFWQMAISPKSGDPVQQRVFMFVPLIFIFFCYNFASALALYWTVQNLFSIVQLYATRNQTAPELQKVSAPAKKKSRV
ncbi:MAG: YidC/Oxa1 family insertase periplasmic-domain containing protein [Verrucomicrobiota bacterium]|nr:YidC/Oxa1 family insertase periplasmic-domain containing protein [Verrucomicrobiota bacterium]